ncbi:uncharacterized protein [Asterias amurensis]|uniref:uncharacterized protein n=1 Tax=Asterias amurensis TaxID=7602 RepID=UPI003AB34557
MARTFVCAIVVAIFVTIPAVASQLCQLYQTERNSNIEWLPETLPAKRFEITFRVLALGDVFIYLGDGLYARLSIEIGVFQNSKTVITGSSSQTSEETPGIIKCDTFSEFWLLYTPSSVKLGRVGQTSPIVTLYHSESYVPTRLGFSTSSASVGLFSFDPFGKTAPTFFEQEFNTCKGFCYDWRLNPMPLGERICFQARTEGVAAIALSPMREPKAGQSLYEIVFGYDENSMIVLRRHMHGEEIEVVEAKDTLNCDEFVSYCIEASGPHIQITRLGDPKILMDFTDSVGIPINYRYIGFAGGYDYCVEWRWPVDIIPKLILETGTQLTEETGVVPVVDLVLPDAETDVQPPLDETDTRRESQGETSIVVPDLLAAVCPVVPKDAGGICVEECGPEQKCDDGQLCCSNGCGHVCKKGCAPVRCKKLCPFGRATDKNGCEKCKCNRNGGKNKNPRKGESSEEDPEISVGETDVQPPSDKPDTPRPRKDRPNNNNDKPKTETDVQPPSDETDTPSENQGESSEEDPEISVGETDVQPPSDKPATPRPRKDRPNNNNDKPKTETDVQPPSDKTDTPSGNQAVCPKVPEGVFGICSEECGADKKCDDGQLCCSNGCGHVCKKGCSPVRCRRYCPFGWATDEDGCDMCKCKRKGGSKGKKENPRRGESSEEDPEISVGETDVPPPSDKPDTPKPRKDRPNNNNNKPKKETDVQPPSDETDTPSGNQAVCPKVPEGVFGICSEECGADKKCDDGQLCCSNGCGHVCKKGCSPVRCRRYCPFGWATDEDGCDMCECKRKGGSKGKKENPRRGESSEEDPEISVGETDVQPPSDKPDTPRPRKDRPNNNNNKPKKETDVQPPSDETDTPSGNQAVCPEVPEGVFGICSEECGADKKCDDGQLCCSNGCGHVCKKGCSPVRCRRYCPFGWATDEDGCDMCKCKRKGGSKGKKENPRRGESSEEDPEISVGETDVQPPSDKPDTPRPRKDRPNNNKPKKETDVQPPSDETDTLSGNLAVCPKVPEGVFGICSEECGADKKCDDGQLCCSNGCGHVCKKGCSQVRCRRYCPFGWATDEDGCDMCECKRKGGSKGKKENPRRGESSEEDPEISVGETDVQPPSDKPDTPRPRKDRPNNNNNKPKKGESSKEDPEISVGETDVQPSSDDPSVPRGNQDEDEGETFTTSGDSSQEIKRTLDKKVISVFEISPFDDKVSKEFQIGCEVGDFKLDVNSETFSLKNGKGEEVDSQTTPDTSGRLKFSIEITESAFIISYILDQDFTTLIEYSPPGREDGKELNCKAFTVKNVDKRRQRGCQIKYTKISQTRWRSYNRRNRPSNTSRVKTGVRERSRGSGSGSGNKKGSNSGGGRRGRGSGSGSGKKDNILSAGVRERSRGSGSGSGNKKGSNSGGGRRGRGSGSGSGKKDKILSAGVRERSRGSGSGSGNKKGSNSGGGRRGRGSGSGSGKKDKILSAGVRERSRGSGSGSGNKKGSNSGGGRRGRGSGSGSGKKDNILSAGVRERSRGSGSGSGNKKGSNSGGGRRGRGSGSGSGKKDKILSAGVRERSRGSGSGSGNKKGSNSGGGRRGRGSGSGSGKKDNILSAGVRERSRGSGSGSGNKKGSNSGGGRRGRGSGSGSGKKDKILSAGVRERSRGSGSGSGNKKGSNSGGGRRGRGSGSGSGKKDNILSAGVRERSRGSGSGSGNKKGSNSGGGRRGRGSGSGSGKKDKILSAGVRERSRGSGSGSGNKKGSNSGGGRRGRGSGSGSGKKDNILSAGVRERSRGSGSGSGNKKGSNSGGGRRGRGSGSGSGKKDNILSAGVRERSRGSGSGSGNKKGSNSGGGRRGRGSGSDSGKKDNILSAGVRERSRGSGSGSGNKKGSNSGGGRRGRGSGSGSGKKDNILSAGVRERSRGSGSGSGNKKGSNSGGGRRGRGSGSGSGKKDNILSAGVRERSRGSGSGSGNKKGSNSGGGRRGRGSGSGSGKKDNILSAGVRERSRGSGSGSGNKKGSNSGGGRRGRGSGSGSGKKDNILSAGVRERSRGSGSGSGNKKGSNSGGGRRGRGSGSGSGKKDNILSAGVRERSRGSGSGSGNKKGSNSGGGRRGRGSGSGSGKKDNILSAGVRERSRGSGSGSGNKKGSNSGGGRRGRGSGSGSGKKDNILSAGVRERSRGSGSGSGNKKGSNSGGGRGGRGSGSGSGEKDNILPAGDTVREKKPESTRRRKQATVQEKTEISTKIRQGVKTKEEIINFSDDVEDVFSLTFSDGTIYLVFTSKTLIVKSGSRVIEEKDISSKVRRNKLDFSVQCFEGGYKVFITGEESPLIDLQREAKCKSISHTSTGIPNKGSTVYKTKEVIKTEIEESVSYRYPTWIDIKDYPGENVQKAYTISGADDKCYISLRSATTNHVLAAEFDVVGQKCSIKQCEDDKLRTCQAPRTSSCSLDGTSQKVAVVISGGKYKLIVADNEILSHDINESYDVFSLGSLQAVSWSTAK